VSHPLFSYPIDSRSSLPRSKEAGARDYSLAAPSTRMTSSIPPIPTTSYPYICSNNKYPVVRDSVVGTATCYRLDGPGIAFWWGPDFMHFSRLSLGLTKPPILWVPDYSRG